MTGRVRSVTGRAVIAAALAVCWVGAVTAAEPSTPPARQTCDQRFPADGPAGVDLRLGCLVSEIVGTFTGATDQGDPAPLSSYLEPLLVVVLALVAAAVALVLSRRLLGRRLAPVLSAEWWSCAACRSLNPAAASRCYACGGVRTAEAGVVTAESRDAPRDR